MNYREIKEYLKGYVEYLSVMYGKEFKLEWRKKYKELVIRGRNPDTTHYVGGFADNYLDLIILNVADLSNNICSAEIRGFYYIGVYQYAYDKLKENNFYLRQTPPFILNIEIRGEDRLREFLEILNDINYFSDGWGKKQ